MRALQKVGVVAASGLLRVHWSALPPRLLGSCCLRHRRLPVIALMQQQQQSSCYNTQQRSSCINNAAAITHDSTTTTAGTTTTITDIDAALRPTTLLVGSQQDEASCAIMSALLARGDWVETTPGVEPSYCEEQGTGKAWTHTRCQQVSLWSVEGRLLDLDDVDRRWTEQRGAEKENLGKRPCPADVVFLSKHVAKSGVPALCVHPIGVPDVSCL